MSTPTDEREDLDSLIGSPGWLRFKAWAEAEYGPMILSRAADEPNEAEALSKLRQARAIRGAMEAMLAWPERRLSNMAAAAARTSTDVSRRGGL
jgi:hypothetical protein